MPCNPFFRKNKQLWLFRPKFSQKWILVSEFQKLSPDLESALRRYHECQFSVKTDIFAQKWIFGCKFQKSKSGFGISIFEICTNFQAKWTTLNFWAQLCPKMDSGVGNSKSGFGIKRFANSQENTCAGVFFYKKRLGHRCFPLWNF